MLFLIFVSFFFICHSDDRREEDVMRIANASYYVGRGDYELFVLDSKNEIVKRKVKLGDSNFEYVEVVSGLQPGDQVVVSDMSSFKNKNKLKVE